MPGLPMRAMFATHCSGVAATTPSDVRSLELSKARTALTSAAWDDIETLRAQPTLPPSQIMPVTVPVMLRMAQPICWSVPPSRYVMAALAAVDAAVAHVQTAASLPTLALM